MSTPVSNLSAVTSNNTDLILKALDYAVFRAPSSADAVTQSALFDSTSGKLLSDIFQTDYVPVGFITNDGATFSRALTREDITVLQSKAPARSDLTGDATTMKYNPVETNWTNIATYIGIDPSSLSTTTDAGGSVSVDQSQTGSFDACRWLAIAYDTARDIYIGKHFPSGVVDSTDDQQFQKTGPVGYPVTVKALFDSTAGTDVRWLFGGAGWLSRLDDIGLTAGSS